MTMLGDFSYGMSNISLHKWYDLCGLRRQEIVGGENKIKYSIYEQISK